MDLEAAWVMPLGLARNAVGLLRVLPMVLSIFGTAKGKSAANLT